jgi:hypothetical protein
MAHIARCHDCCSPLHCEVNETGVHEFCDRCDVVPTVAATSEEVKELKVRARKLRKFLAASQN